MKKSILIFLYIFLMFAYPCFSADVKISELPDGSASVASTNIIPAVIGGTTYRLTLANIFGIYISDTAYNATSWDNVTTICPSKNAIRDYLESIMPTGSDGSRYLEIANNTARSPDASKNQFYPEANVWKFNENGTERSRVACPSAGPVTIAGPTAARTVTIADADQTLLNSTASGVQAFLTTPSLANLGSMLTDEGTGVITAMGNNTNGSGGFITYGNAAGTAAPLTGYSKGAGTVAATDTILQAIQKLDGNDDAKAPLANPQFTGVVDIAANATTDAEGEITIDTTTNQLRYYGGAQRVLSPIQSASFVITAPADTDDINIMKAPYGMTILGIDCIVQGTTSATGQLQECTSAGASCADLDSDITCDADGAADDGTLTDSTIASGAWLRWKTTSLSGTPTFLTVTFRYLVVAD